MRVTSPFAAGAAAVGLLAGLALEARASTLSGEVRPYAVAVAWLTPGGPSTAGVEEGPLGTHAAPPRRKAERLPKLPPMRAGAPGSAPAARQAPDRVPRKVLAGSRTCPRAPAAAAAARDVRRT
ncbi:MAG TPA: hypothetical protein VHG08_14995 [Longimicrobium sp.]|nr:hypothetical protein [Longimicrobium sp.]